MADSRDELGFGVAAADAFSFLAADFGLVRNERAAYWLRWESPTRFVDVVHDPRDFELGVHFGRWLGVPGEGVEQRFPLGDFLQALGEGSPGSHGWHARERDQLVRYLHELADATRAVAARVLSSDDVFDVAGQLNSLRCETWMDDMRAGELRARAQEAWRRMDFARVVDAYSEIDRELQTVELTPSEIGKLGYALRALDREE